MRTLLVLALLLLGSSCLVSRRTTNDRLDPDRLARLEPGRTTAREAVELLGAPTEVVQLAGRSAYRWDATVSKNAGLILLVVALYNNDSRQDRAWLFFDESDVLTHVGATLSADEAEYSMPWSDLDD